MSNLFTASTLAIAGIASSLALPALAADYRTGLNDLVVTEGHATRKLEGFVWYPTDATEGAARHHNNPVWSGIEAIEGAAAAEGRFPLLVLSHGMYGNPMGQSWLADAMARQGWIVAAVAHPGTSTWERDPDDARELWERPRDVSRVIDQVLAEEGLNVDPERIFMAGHSLGGFTAIALAGGRYDAAKVEAMCAANADPLICGIFDRWNVAKTPEDVAAMEADLSDPRIKGFAVLDLGGTQVFSPRSLAAIEVPMLVYGAPLDIDGTGLNLANESRALVRLLERASVTYHEPADLSHFDFMGVCTDQALMILKEEEPEDLYVCKGGTDERAADHDRITAEITAFFEGL